MFAMVVSAVRFAHRREMRWFLALVASTVLAYATFEGIYLTLAIFGAFLAILLVWELAYFLARSLTSRPHSRRAPLLQSRRPPDGAGCCSAVSWRSSR